MILLADEHMDRAIVEWLRTRCDEVIWAAENYPGAEDSFLLKIAEERRAVIITKDLDFGELVVAQQQSVTGVILLRVFQLPTREHLKVIQDAWSIVIDKVQGHLVVIAPGHVRFRPLRMS